MLMVCQKTACILMKRKKEMLIHFGTKTDIIQYLASLLMVNLTVERITNFKLLGVVISSDLS